MAPGKKEERKPPRNPKPDTVRRRIHEAKDAPATKSKPSEKTKKK